MARRNFFIRVRSLMMAAARLAPTPGSCSSSLAEAVLIMIFPSAVTPGGATGPAGSVSSVSDGAVRGVAAGVGVLLVGVRREGATGPAPLWLVPSSSLGDGRPAAAPACCAPAPGWWPKAAWDFWRGGASQLAMVVAAR